MTKDSAPCYDDEFVVQHLADPNDWVADHERSSCYVCSRMFGTFRRKHHCRMCGEVVCSGCTLHKNALIATIGQTRVRVCISCIFNNGETQKDSRPYSPRLTSPTTLTSEESQRWLHSPLPSKWDHEYDDSLSSLSSPEYDDERNNQFGHFNPHHPITSSSHSSGSHSSQPPRYLAQDNQDTNEYGSPLNGSAWTHPWPRSPVPFDEAERLETVHALQVLDSAPEKPFEMICDLAKARLSCPMAAVSFMDEHRQWFKASTGLAHKMIPRKISFCAYTIFSKESMVVLDTLKDKRFEHNPLVSGAAAVRFYAAAPILDRRTGHAIGSVFVLDTRPRESCDVALLERLAYAASEHVMERVEDTTELDDEKIQELKKRHVEQQHQLHQKKRVPASVAPPSPTHQVPEPPQPPAPLAVVESGEGNLSDALMTTATSNGEPMEVLLMRLLTQNTETQQQLATQQMSLNTTLSSHSVQINRLMTDFARMEAKLHAKVKPAH